MIILVSLSEAVQLSSGGMMDTNMLALHIKQQTLKLDDFQKSFNAFTNMIKSLADDAAPTTYWMVSVDRGSMLLNAQLKSDDTSLDLAPIFEVIEGGVTSLASGEGVENCPKQAREEYRKLVSVVGKQANHNPLAEILTFKRSTSADRVIPVVESHDVQTAPRRYQAAGSVTGVICLIDVKRSNKFGMYDEASGRYVKGTFRDHLLHDITSAMKCRTTVAGILTYQSDGKIASIDVRSVVVQPKKLPKLSSLFGILEA